ncbi:GPS1 [Acanthosepion pharaonis]|uniref:GPS1 n=1 Tax=Acanthosepion pharaonis TaxID=158019 RepID=A0A812AU72_ACAPH|nr:GPS1 [Sepia pharaonis]
MPYPSICQALEEPMQVDVIAEEKDNGKKGFTVENATLDLESYSKHYEGFVKLNRLLFIINHCPTLKTETLQLALDCVQTTHDTNLYQQIYKQLQEMASSSSNSSVKVPPLDNHWIETTNRKAQQTLEKLDSDLKNYKTNSIKESIRRGNDDLGDHYLDMGDLCNALKCYSRARDYCTSPKHVVNMCLNVIKISIFIENWPQVINHIQKAENTILRSEMLSVNNVATYGTLCALALFDRQELQKNVISNLGFKMFLESEPQLRHILNTFNQSKYYFCLKLMEEIKNNLLLDIFLAPHIKKLYTLIRNKALCQYFSPYLSADMHKMAEAFNTNVKDLEDELMQLILEGQINARIDSHNKILYAKDIDQRSSTFEKSIAMGQEYERRTKAMILRSALIKYHLLVMCPVLKEKSPAASEVATPSGNSTPVQKLPVIPM